MVVSNTSLCDQGHSVCSTKGSTFVAMPAWQFQTLHCMTRDSSVCSTKGSTFVAMAAVSNNSLYDRPGAIVYLPTMGSTFVAMACLSQTLHCMTRGNSVPTYYGFYFCCHAGMA